MVVVDGIEPPPGQRRIGIVDLEEVELLVLFRDPDPCLEGLFRQVDGQRPGPALGVLEPDPAILEPDLPIFDQRFRFQGQMPVTHRVDPVQVKGPTRDGFGDR